MFNSGNKRKVVVARNANFVLLVIQEKNQLSQTIEVFVNNTNLTFLTFLYNVSDFQILIKSCSNESRNDPSPKSEVVHETKFSLKISYSTHACLAQLDQHQTCKPVMVSVVNSSSTGGNFIFKTPRC